MEIPDFSQTVSKIADDYKDGVGNFPTPAIGLGSVTWQMYWSTHAKELITTKPNFKRMKDVSHTVHRNLPK